MIDITPQKIPPMNSVSTRTPATTKTGTAHFQFRSRQLRGRGRTGNGALGCDGGEVICPSGRQAFDTPNLQRCQLFVARRSEFLVVGAGRGSGSAGPALNKQTN